MSIAYKTTYVDEGLAHGIAISKVPGLNPSWVNVKKKLLYWVFVVPSIFPIPTIPVL